MSFTPALQRHVPCPPLDVPGVVFVNGRQVKDRSGLSDPLPEGGEVYVMQALSGG